MRIPDLFQPGKTEFSVEIYPPKKADNINIVYAAAEKISLLKPDYISVTYGAGASLRDNMTCEIASEIQQRYGVPAVAHLTCVNATRAEIMEMIKQLQALGIENVLALRGDINPDIPPKRELLHASDLALMLQKYADFSVLGACYPEGHYECDSLAEDVENLKYKIGAGVSALVTQLFLDNDVFYRFMDRIRAAGIRVPVSAGIMPIVKDTQIARTIKLSGTSLPHSFTALVGRYENDPDSLYQAGIDFAAHQINDLINHGVDGIHLYCMNRATVARAVYERTFGQRPGIRIGDGV